MDFNIPTEIPNEEVGGEDKIMRVAENTLADTSPPELERFHISFYNYIEDKCSVDGMDANNAQTAIKMLRDIGLDFKGYDHFIKKHAKSRLEIKVIRNSSPYDDYYRRLPDEIVDGEEVREIKYVDTRPGKEVDLRIFYYTLSNIFYMLAITAESHENLDHKPFVHKVNKKHY